LENQRRLKILQKFSKFFAKKLAKFRILVKFDPGKSSATKVLAESFAPFSFLDIHYICHERMSADVCCVAKGNYPAVCMLPF
jgi:hypothetical protein